MKADFVDPGLPREQQIKGREKIQEDNSLRPESLRQAAGGHGDEAMKTKTKGRRGRTS